MKDRKCATKEALDNFEEIDAKVTLVQEEFLVVEKQSWTGLIMTLLQWHKVSLCQLIMFWID